MNRFTAIGLIALVLPIQANAEVYKCITNGKSTYQAAPCPSGSNEPPLKIKSATDSQKSSAAEFQKKLAAENKNKANQRAKQLEAAKDAQIKADRQMIKGAEEYLIRHYFDKQEAGVLLHDSKVLPKTK